MLKLRLSFFFAVLFLANAKAQTVVYEIPFAGLVGLELTSGDMCSAPYIVEEAKQISLGNQWGCTWTSTGSGAATAVTVAFGYTVNDQTNIVTLLNGVSNNGQSAGVVNCDGSTVSVSWSVDPANYNTGGVNTFLVDYAASGQINQLDHMYSTTVDIYMTVTVDYSPCTHPTVTLNEGTNVSCHGGSNGAIDINVTGGVQPYSFDWDNDGTGDFDDPQNLSGLPAGTYNVVVMEYEGCTQTFSYTVTEPAPLDLSVTQVGANLSSNATGVTYQWLDCADWGVITGATNQNYTAVANGNYAVMISNGVCSDTSACYEVSSIGFFENDPIWSVHIYPNPASDKIIFSSDKAIKNGKLTIMDVSMKIIAVQSMQIQADQPFEIDLSTFAKGTYLMVIETDQHGRLVRQLSIL